MKPQGVSPWRGSAKLLPALLFLGLFFLAPLVGLLLRGVLEPTPGLDNYAQLFANSAYTRVLFNTFAVGALVTLISLLLGFPLAWAITLVPRGWGRWLLNIVLLSMWTSLLARTYSWLVLLQASGVINKVLMALGIIDRLRQRGLSAPYDMSVTGFDNVAVSTFVWPNLTTVDLPRVQMGRMSIDALLDILESPSRPAMRRPRPWASGATRMPSTPAPCTPPAPSS